MDTHRIASFVASADAGSLSTAAARLRLPLSTISRHVAELEAELAAPLFVRTGRGVRLTAAGERFLARGRQILRELELARAEVRGDAGVDLPHLRLSAPPDVAHGLLPAALAVLAGRHPRLTVDARAEVRRVSLAEESYDAAIRLGPLAPSELIASRLGAVSLLLCAAPGPPVRGVRELAAREFALIDGVPTELTVARAGRRTTLSVRGRIRVGTFLAAAELAARSDRVVALPSFIAGPFLAGGRLVRVAPALALPAVELSLLRLPRHRGSPVLADLAAALSAAIGDVERAA